MNYLVHAEMRDLSILFLAKEKPLAREASDLVTSHFSDSVIVFGEPYEPFPKDLLNRTFDYVISYISPWIVPKKVLDNAKIAAINFHPGSPEYPGIGCTNFAIYNGEKSFGITCHHMAERVDTGRIIYVERFPIFEKDTVFSLTQRCYAFIYVAFVKVFATIIDGTSLPNSKEKWKREPYTRRELDDLCVIDDTMSDEEVKKRVKATSYPGMPGAYMVRSGIRFNAEVKHINRRGQNDNEKNNNHRGGGNMPAC